MNEPKPNTLNGSESSNAMSVTNSDADTQEMQATTSARLEILKASLSKKQSHFDAKLQAHFDTVKQTNGQPLNDKRNGNLTLKKWDKQNETLRNLNDSIARTKEAIERETAKMAGVAAVQLPECIKQLIDTGVLQQWRKHPIFFFVVGIEKARIKLLANNSIAHMYVKEITDKDQYAKFRDIFNGLNKQMREAAK